MSLLPGVYVATKKDGTVYYRSSITYRNKHISLGSFVTENEANKAYQIATDIVREGKYVIEDYNVVSHINRDKFVSLINFRDNGIYFKNPIYLRANYFEYYFNDKVLKFDKEDLFFYGNHKLQRRGGYIFICDYGSQYGILSRYGIRNFGVAGRDYIYVNGDENDYRYMNIKVINNYVGVIQKEEKGKFIYEAFIHVKGNFIIGRYDNEIDGAIAYNKAVDILRSLGSKRRYVTNYVTNLTAMEYASRYNDVNISDKISKIEFL